MTAPAYFCFFLYIASMRCVTKKPPKILTDAKINAMKPKPRAHNDASPSPTSATPTASSAPTTMRARREGETGKALPRPLGESFDLDHADIGDFTGHDTFVNVVAFDRAIDQHRARFHRAHHLGADQARRGAPRNQRGGDDDVL